MFYSIHEGLMLKPTVQFLDKLLLTTFKISCDYVHKLILDLVTLTSDPNVDVLREDPILDAMGISVSAEIIALLELNRELLH